MQRIPPFLTILRRSLALLAFTATAVSAQNYPSKPIEWVVPYPAGGGSDAVARSLVETMGNALGQAIVINNKPGAATNIGADYVAHAKPDGYTLLTGDTATLAANPALYSKLNYSAEKDFTPVGLLARFPMVLVVNPGVPAKNLTE
ncbi:MAG: tripartite tricarboxylate transporter substrate binding protein, partial [Sulfuriferula multivorans]|nr:tripartite tricarboxylate transporter substrate binding protein [Sulfuriferula multivorans]